MNLSPTDEQQQLKDVVRRVCAEHITPERLAAWAKSATGVDERFWNLAAELGWFGLGLPQSAGGSGLGLAHVACLIEECGRGLVARPIVNAIRAAVALAGLDPNAPELAGLATGKQRLALAFAERQARSAQHYATAIVRSGQREFVDGEKWYVADGAAADWHLVAAKDGRDIVLVLVDARRADVSPLRTFDDDRQSRLRYTRCPLVRRVVASGDVTARLLNVQRRQTALALAEMIGGMAGVLARTVDYVKEREQFGQKLAVFQAVQHQIADMATSYTCARHLGWQAITRLAAGSEQGAELEMAAAYVGQAFKRLSLAAHHLHGGAGYVVEHPLHFYAERAQSLCVRETPEAQALEAVAQSLLDQ